MTLAHGLMFGCTSAALLLPLFAMRIGWLSLRRDLIFLAFYVQPLIYLFVVPTLNATFPDSSFAFPTGYDRVITYTRDMVDTYAYLELAVLTLFVFPLVFVYARVARRPPAGQPRELTVSPSRFHAFCSFGSAVGIAYLVVAVRHGLLSPYAATPENLLDVPRVEFFFLRAYPVAHALLVTLFAIVMTLPSLRRHEKWTAAALFAPALVATLVRVSMSRFELLAFCAIVIGATAVKTRLRLRSVAIALAIGVVGLRYIPSVRQGVATAGDFSTITPSETIAGVTRSTGMKQDFGARLDGIEVMALSTSAIVEHGPLYCTSWPTLLLVPISPAFPEFEKSIKLDKTAAVQKTRYLMPFVRIDGLDYPTVSLTEIYANLWIAGFPIAAWLFGMVFAKTTRRVRHLQTYSGTVIAVFFLCHAFMFEQDFTGLLFSWMRGAPMLAVILAMRVWSTKEPVAPAVPFSAHVASTGRLRMTYAHRRV